ncbi:hypothetical protein WIS52_03260 [Pseudonocardia nematodicida]|uniref:Uncharacterized protein n=1 Tax=Pseudonocardia nematodicida TaxID=1206997 RepID=A0ABV1K4U9_9PSEU
MRWPASRWQVLAEADAWGVSGVVARQLAPLPEGRYPSLEAVVETLVGMARGAGRGDASGPGGRPHLLGRGGPRRPVSPAHHHAPIGRPPGRSAH